MKYLSLIAILICSLTLITSCDKDDDPVDEDFFTLTIENRSGVDLDIYLKSSRNNKYDSQGTVTDGNDRSISNLVVGVQYTVGIIEAGGDPEDINNESTFTNDDPQTTEYVLTIN